MTSQDYVIRPITPDEIGAWWELRLRSLRDHPDAFGADYDEAQRRGPDYLRPATVDGRVDRLFAAFARMAPASPRHVPPATRANAPISP